MFNHAIQYLQHRTIGLDGLLVQVPNYIKSGFEILHRNRRYLLNEIKPLSNTLDSPKFKVMELDDNRHLETVKNFDSNYFPASRDTWLKGLLSSSAYSSDKHDVKAICIGVFNNESDSSSENASILSGFGVIRKSEKGHRVGPLYATSFAIAKTLLCSLFSRVKVSLISSDSIENTLQDDLNVYIDVPIRDDNQAIDLVESNFENERIFESCRMYTNIDNSLVEWSGIYGLSSLELG